MCFKSVHIDDNLTWTNHFQHVSKKIPSYIWLLFQIKSYPFLQHRVLFYNAYIKPHFEYYCVVWGNSFNSNLHKIEKLERRACKLILGTDYISLEDARRQLNLLYDWRESCLLIDPICLHKSLFLPGNWSKPVHKLILHENQLELVSRS